MTERERVCLRALESDPQREGNGMESEKDRLKEGRKWMRRGREVEDRRMKGRRHGGQFIHISH